MSQIERNRKRTIDTWAIFWYYSIFKKNKLCVYPKKNLVINTGFNKYATNTKIRNRLFINNKLYQANKVIFYFSKIYIENNKILKKIKLKMKLFKYTTILKNFFGN